MIVMGLVAMATAPRLMIQRLCGFMGLVSPSSVGMIKSFKSCRQLHACLEIGAGRPFQMTVKSVFESCSKLLL